MVNKNIYDAGKLEVSNIFTNVTLDMVIRQLLIYPTEDCFVTLNESTKEIFVPKNMWTPICVSSYFLCSSFAIKTETTCTAYWQGWVN